MTHLHTYGALSQDDYRREMMKNTLKLYKGLPAKAIYHEGTTNPLQISEIADKRLVFLDIKFPRYPKLAHAFRQRFIRFAEDEKLPFTTRPSFGFPNTNFTVIDGKKFRINPGLEDSKIIARYQKFFETLQTTIDEVMADPNITTMPPQQIDAMLAKRTKQMIILK